MSSGTTAMDGSTDVPTRENNTYVRINSSRAEFPAPLLRLRLSLDPTVCDGHGLCAALYPEGVALDDWGYPIVSAADVSAQDLVHARRAVSTCPALALRLTRVADPPGPETVEG